MLNYAKYRHYDPSPVKFTGMSRTFRTRNSIESNRSLNHPIIPQGLKSQSTEHAPFNSAQDLWLGIAKRSRLDNSPPNIFGNKHNQRANDWQHPPPDCSLNRKRRALWKIAWQYPPPHMRLDRITWNKRRSKDPPLWLMHCALRTDKPSVQQRWLIMDERWLGLDKLTLFRQHPPPTWREALDSRARWKFAWQHPPPHTRRDGTSYTNRRSKDPPLWLMHCALRTDNLSAQQRWLDMTELWLGPDKLALFRQHPPPTWREAQDSCARWKIAWQHPPPHTRHDDITCNKRRSKDPPLRLMPSTLHPADLSAQQRWLNLTMRWLGPDKLALFRQHPPPTWREAQDSRARWKIAWQHPPPYTRHDDITCNKLRSKDPPLWLIHCALRSDNLSTQQRWLDLTERWLGPDRLVLFRQHPPPTRCEAEDNRVRWKFAWQHPPPMQRERTHFSNLITCISKGADMASYNEKPEHISSVFLNMDELNLIQKLNATLLLATYNVACSTNDNDSDKTRHESFSTLASKGYETKNLKRQILPTDRHIGDHNCLVGKYCLPNKKAIIKMIIH